MNNKIKEIRAKISSLLYRCYDIAKIKRCPADGYNVYYIRIFRKRFLIRISCHGTNY